MSWLTRPSIVWCVSIIAGATVDVAQAQPLGSFKIVYFGIFKTGELEGINNTNIIYASTDG